MILVVCCTIAFFFLLGMLVVGLLVKKLLMFWSPWDHWKHDFAHKDSTYTLIASDFWFVLLLHLFLISHTCSHHNQLTKVHGPKRPTLCDIFLCYVMLKKKFKSIIAMSLYNVVIFSITKDWTYRSTFCTLRVTPTTFKLILTLTPVDEG